LDNINDIAVQQSNKTPMNLLSAIKSFIGLMALLKNLVKAGIFKEIPEAPLTDASGIND
jgi:hypothetical protein